MFELEGLWRIDIKIELKLEEIARMQRLKSYATEESTITKIDNYISGIKKDVSELAVRKKQALETIDKLPNSDHKTLLHLRYLRNLTWEEVAQSMFFSLRYTYTLHKKALAALKGYI